MSFCPWTEIWTDYMGQAQNIIYCNYLHHQDTVSNPGILTQAGIPYAVAHCQACFDLQSNGFCSQGNKVWFIPPGTLKQTSVALHIKTSLTMGNDQGYPTQCSCMVQKKSDLLHWNQIPHSVYMYTENTKVYVLWLEVQLHFCYSPQSQFMWDVWVMWYSEWSHGCLYPRGGHWPPKSTGMLSRGQTNEAISI